MIREKGDGEDRGANKHAKGALARDSEGASAPIQPDSKGALAKNNCTHARTNWNSMGEEFCRFFRMFPKRTVLEINATLRV